MTLIVTIAIDSDANLNLLETGIQSQATVVVTAAIVTRVRTCIGNVEGVDQEVSVALAVGAAIEATVVVMAADRQAEATVVRHLVVGTRVLIDLTAGVHLEAEATVGAPRAKDAFRSVVAVIVTEVK